jgi:hypothetical protein
MVFRFGGCAVIGRVKCGAGEALLDVWFEPDRGVMVYLETRDQENRVLEARVFTLSQLVMEIGLAVDDGEDIVI